MEGPQKVDPEVTLYENSPNKDRTLDNVKLNGEPLISGPTRL